MTNKPTIKDSLLLCASDLQHSAIYDNHIEMQSCIRAVADRITALVSVIDGVGRAALAAPAQPVAWQVNHIADHVADNWPRRKYDLAEIEQRLRGIPAAPQPAAPAQVVPAPGVEAVSEREFKQFLSDVLTAAGLVTHGKKCKDLGRRLGEMSMRLLTAPKTAAAPAQAGEYQPSSADMVMAALDTEEWGLERMQHWHCLTDEGNREGAWLVKRQKAPYCADKPGALYGPRSWSGPTALDALQKAADDLGIRLPQPAARGAAQAAPVDAAVKPAINVGTIGHVGSGRTTLTAALGKLIAAQKGSHD